MIRLHGNGGSTLQCRDTNHVRHRKASSSQSGRLRLAFCFFSTNFLSPVQAILGDLSFINRNQWAPGSVSVTPTIWPERVQLRPSLSPSRTRSSRQNDLFAALQRCNRSQTHCHQTHCATVLWPARERGGPHSGGPPCVARQALRWKCPALMTRFALDRRASNATTRSRNQW